MAILGNLLGGIGLSRRQSSGGMWSRGYSRPRASGSYGRARSPSGYFGGSLGRMTMGGLAAFAARRFLTRRSGY